MGRALLLVLTVILVAGCTTAEEQETRDREACAKRTGEVGTSAYDTCRRELYARRELAKRSQIEWNIGNYRQNVGR